MKSQDQVHLRRRRGRFQHAAGLERALGVVLWLGLGLVLFGA